ncbi:uncharacterized protein [Onthophagus taurus]|uniref:uncharacterized protein n=1 Tax=Onthophagus taurus TaxID=166361 RepID=UPI000C20A032|nr:tetra-peptide repeat homeobox protein 1-like [Onthophagus taurus]
MNFYVCVFAICYVAVAQAKPGQFDFVSSGGGGDGSSGGGSDYGASSGSQQPQNFQLVAVPDDFSLNLPSFDIQELGSSQHGNVGGESVKVTKVITVKEPQPYPVHIPQPIPVPVHVPKPVPVPVTKIVQVPKPYPVEIEKKVPVPIEVPKPYPVSSSGGGSGGGYGVHDQSGGYSNNQPLYQPSSSDERK